MVSTFINVYNHVAKRILSDVHVNASTEDNDVTGKKLHVCTMVTNYTTCKQTPKPEGGYNYDPGWDILFYAIYDPKTRQVVESGKYDTGKPMNQLGSLPDYGKLHGFCKGHGRFASVFHAPIAGKKDNRQPLVGEGEIIEVINKYCFSR